MKKLILLLGLLICIVFIIQKCPDNISEKSDILAQYQNNNAIFLQASESNDYSAVEKLRGVKGVYISQKYADISFGGAGFGPDTQYYGIFYSADGDMCAIDLAGPKDELAKRGNGYLYQELNGDNRYYVEPLGNNFFYYEAEF